MNTGNNSVSNNHSKSDAITQTSQQYNCSNCLLGHLYNNFDLEKSEGYGILKDFIDEFCIDLSTGSEEDPIVFNADDVHIAKCLSSVQIQPFEINPSENFDKVIHVGDIHGDFKSLYSALLVFFREQLFDSNIAIVFTGDYVDRGNDSILCLLLVATFMKKCVKNVFFLKGNHETNGSCCVIYNIEKVIIERAIDYFIKTLPATAILTVNGLKTMFIHGTPIVVEERRKEILNDDFNWFSIDNVVMDAILANTREELEKIANDFIKKRCGIVSKHYKNGQEIRIYEDIVKRFQEFAEKTEEIQNEIYELDISILDELFKWEERINDFIEYLKELNTADIFKDIHADYNREEWYKFIESPTLENLPTEDIIIKLPKETFEKITRECQEFIKDISEIVEMCKNMLYKIRNEDGYKSIKSEIHWNVYEIRAEAESIESYAESYYNMMFRAANGVHQKIPKENFEKAIKKHANEKLPFKKIIELEKDKIQQRACFIDKTEMFWGDVVECYEEIYAIETYNGRQQLSSKLVDKYMHSNDISILFRGHQCPTHDGWDVFINGEISENELEDFAEQDGIKKVFTKKLTEGNRMISTCHTSEVYKEVAPRIFIVSDGSTIEAYRIV